MGDTGIIVRFPGTLNPTAQEFTPTGANHIPLAVTIGVPYPYPYLSAADVPPPAYLSTSPTRSLLLSPVPFTTETALRRDLEAFGDVRAVQTEALRYGIVTVHFYDLRHAQTAFAAIRTHHVHCTSFFNSLSYYPQFHIPPPPPALVAGCPLWAHYAIPAAASEAFPDAHNQGTLVVFNLDEDVTAHHLRQAFEPFGPIKELRDTPGKKNQRFIEFFDIRDAAMALKQMNGKEINGRSVIIEFSKPGGFGRRFFQSAHSPSPIFKKPLHLNITNPPPPPPPPPFSPHSPRRRFSPRSFNGGRSPNSIANSRSVESMGSLSLSGEVGNEHSQHRRNFVRKQSSRESTVEAARNRHWKGKQGKNLESSRFLIKEDAVAESKSRDSRTTLMIKNIPNKYSQKLLLKMLDKHCIHCNEQIGDGDEQPLSSYDFVYLPIDFNNECNVGYGFVNMTSPEATLRLYKAFHRQRWEVFNSRKICEVTYAKIQGLEALKEHFKNSKFPYEMEHYLPVVFSPPRDGRQLTEPLPIVGMMMMMMMTTTWNKHQTSCVEMANGDRAVAGASSASEDALSSNKSGGVGDDDDTSDRQGSGGLHHTDQV